MREKDALWRMPRLMITGYLEGRYEDFFSKTDDKSAHRYRFTEHLNLNVRGFVLDRRLLHYSVALDWQESQGTAARGGYKGVNLGLKFLPFQPFTMDLRAGYIDGDGYTLRSGGLSLAYARAVMPPPKKMTDQARQQGLQPAQQQQGQAEGNEQDQAEWDETEEEKREREEIEKRRKLQEELLRKRLERGFLYYALPRIFTLDFDTYNAKTRDADNTYYNARLLMKGGYGKTLYFATITDYYTKDNIRGTSTNQFTSDLASYTRWDRASLDAKAYFAADGGSSYGLQTNLSGLLGKSWDYGLSAGYSVSDNHDRTTSYSAGGNIRSSATRGITSFNYGFGAGYIRQDGPSTEENAFVTASFGADNRFSQKVSLNTSVGLTAGTERSSGSFNAGVNYRPLNRLHLYARYSLGVSSGEDRFADTAALRRINESPLHTAEAGLNYYSRINFSSNVTLSVSPAKESSGINALVSTVVAEKINISLGASLSRDKPREFVESGADENRNYNAYGIVSTPFFFRNSFFSVSSSYSKTVSSNLLTGLSRTTQLLAFNPTIRWFWRRLIIEADGRYTITAPDEGARTIDRRITLTVTRPFRLL